MPTVAAVVVCAGASTRMGTDKIFASLCARPVIAHTLLGFENADCIDGIVVVTRKENFDKIKDIALKYGINKLKCICEGGKTRAHSVLSGVDNADADYVAITDGARPLVTPALIERCCADAFLYGAAAPGIAVADTLKRVDGENNIITTVDRASLVRIQTPQVMPRAVYRDCLKKALELDVEFTDDCSVFEYFGHSVKLSEGSGCNIKLTYPEDIEICERLMATMDIRVGHGYDVHRFKEGRELWLCGERIDYEYGLDGHSDADVALHALTDAILGAAGLGDIGRHFPDTDMQYKGISSVLLLKKVWADVSKTYALGNCDVTVIAQKPKLLPHIENMKKNIAEALECDITRVNVKATTEEKLGFTGRLEGISSHAVCTLCKK